MDFSICNSIYRLFCDSEELIFLSSLYEGRKSENEVSAFFDGERYYLCSGLSHHTSSHSVCIYRDCFFSFIMYCYYYIGIDTESESLIKISRK